MVRSTGRAPSRAGSSAPHLRGLDDQRVVVGVVELGEHRAGPAPGRNGQDPGAAAPPATTRNVVPSLPARDGVGLRLLRQAGHPHGVADRFQPRGVGQQRGDPLRPTRIRGGVEHQRHAAVRQGHQAGQPVTGGRVRRAAMSAARSRSSTIVPVVRSTVTSRSRQPARRDRGDEQVQRPAVGIERRAAEREARLPGDRLDHRRPQGAGRRIDDRRSVAQHAGGRPCAASR